MIYLDYASTTPVNQEVLKAYTYVLEKYYANTDSLHDAGLSCGINGTEQGADSFLLKSESE